jgi:autotransporter-associated beta strand protein
MRCAVALLAFVAAPAAAQQTFTWSGLGSSNLWSIGPNWQGNIPPSSTPLTAVILTGDTQTANVLNLGALSLNSLTFAGEAGPFAVTQSGTDFFNFFPTPGAAALPHIDQFSSFLQTLHLENTGLQLNSNLVFGGAGAGTVAINGELVSIGGPWRVGLTGPYTVTLSTTIANGIAGFDVAAGTLRVNSDIAFGSGATTLGSTVGTSAGTLQLIGNLALTRPLVVNAGGGTIDTNGFAASMANTALTVTGAGRLTLTNTSGTGSSTINGQLQQTGGLLVTGANNTVTLGNNGNTFSGPTTINGGATLATNSDLELGNTSGITLDNGTLKLIYPSGYNTNRPVTLGPGGGTISIDTTVAPTGFNGAIGGSGGLTKTGTGRIGLLAANTYTGPTTVTGGYLDVVNNQALQNTTVTLNGGTLGFFGPATVPVIGGLAGSSNLAIGGLPGLSVGNNNSSTTYAGNLSGVASSGLFKIGAGAWTLTGANTQIGAFNIQAGTVVAGSAGALSSTAPVTVSTGATLDLGGFNYTVIGNNTPLTVQGTLRFSGASLNVAASGKATLDGATVANGVIRGPGTTVVTGGATLSGITTFNSTVINQTGAGSLNNFVNGGAYTVASGAGPAVFNGFSNEGSGSVTLATNAQVSVADFQSYGVLTVSPGAGPGVTLLTNTGTSPLYFNGGSRTFIGTPQTVVSSSAGIDLHGQNLVVAGGLFVNNGFVADSTATPGSVIVDYGALYKGAGTNFVNVITQNGGRVQAGNSPGAFLWQSLTIGPGGVQNFDWQINNARGTGGPSPDANNLVSGWSQLQSKIVINSPGRSDGNLTWTATSVPGNHFNMALIALLNPTPVGSDNFGPMDNFHARLNAPPGTDDGDQGFVWPVFTWQGTYSGPMDDATLTADTNFDLTNFANPHPGTFSLHYDGANKAIDLVYTPSAVPEPGTLALVLVVALPPLIRRGLARRH